MSSGAQLLERLIFHLIQELSQMLILDSQLVKWNMIINWERPRDIAPLQVVSKQMHNCLMRLHGPLKEILIQILLELNTEIDIINLNHSTNLPYSTNMEEWRERNTFMIRMILNLFVTGKMFQKQISEN